MTKELLVNKPRRWAAYAAAIWAIVFATISAYWAAGGTIGLSTIGGHIETIALTRSAMGRTLAWSVVIIKLGGVILALILTRSWRQMTLRKFLLPTCWASSTLLIAYGGINVIGESLVVSGLIHPTAQVDWHALQWHLALWDPSFVLWGVLLSQAAYVFQTRILQSEHNH